MANRYFKKFSPGNKVTVQGPSGQEALQFDTLDGLLGYFGTDNEGLAKQFEEHMRAQRFGLTEISEEEYMEQYAQKKMSLTNSPKPWREELSRSAGLGLVDRGDVVSRLGSEAVQAAVAVSGRSDIRRNGPPVRMEAQPSPSPAPTPANAPTKKEEFQLNTGGRKPKAQPLPEKTK